MMSDYTEQANLVVNLEAMTLDELGEYTTREANLAEAHAAKAIEHAIACGEALLLAKSQCRHGEFQAWREEHFPMSKPTAIKWMRIAYYKDRIVGVENVKSAERLLVGLPRPAVDMIPATWVANARQMRDAGASWAEIAEGVGLHKSTVRRAIDPTWKQVEAEKRRRERDRLERLAASAARRKEIARLAAQRDDATSKLYSLIRQALPLAEAARDAAATPEQRDRFDAVARAQRRSEDQIGAALRAERGES